MSFKRWCLTKFAVKEANYATHLFMDCGKIKVPLSEFPEFLKRYYDVYTYENVCLIEKLGHNCQMRFFLDVDIKHTNFNHGRICITFV